MMLSHYQLISASPIRLPPISARQSIPRGTDRKYVSQVSFILTIHLILLYRLPSLIRVGLPRSLWAPWIIEPSRIMGLMASQPQQAHAPKIGQQEKERKKRINRASNTVGWNERPCPRLYSATKPCPSSRASNSFILTNMAAC